MGLTETTIDTMKACKPILIAKRKVLGCRFYELLFTEHPVGMLSSLVDKITNKHNSFGVKPEQYSVVGTILLQTLEEVRGKEVFNDEVKAAISEAYFFLADILIKTEEEMKKEKEKAIGGWNGWRKNDCHEKS